MRLIFPHEICGKIRRKGGKVFRTQETPFKLPTNLQTGYCGIEPSRA